MSVLPGSAAAVFAFGRFVLDRDRRLLTRDGAAVSLTPKAFDLLVLLVERGGAAVSKETLMTALWPDTVVEENNLAFQISTLRKALGADGAGSIATLPGRGYQFVAPLQRLESSAPVSRAAPAARTVRSLAVLPFKPLGAERDEALELGMADTLITRLSPMPEVTVRPISAVRRYSQLDQDPLAAGGALGVDAVLDGSIQRRGSRIRVTVRLLHTIDGRQIWASQFDDDAHDLFAVQDLVADRVARAIVPALTRAPETRLAHRTTDDLEAYELYLKGRYWTYSDPLRAEEFFRRAVDRDPRFAAAWAAIADSWLLQGRYGDGSPHAKFAKAREAAMRAVAVDPDLAEGHAALAQVYADHDWDWRRAEEEYRRALELNPNSEVAHGHFAYLLLFRREFRGAVEHARRAIEIDPVSPMWNVTLGFILDCMGNYDEAIAHLEELLRLHPRFLPALLHLGLAYTNAGNPAAGIASFDAGLALQPGWPPLLALQAYAYACAGNRETALTILHDLEARCEQEPAPAQNLAMAWTTLGDHDRAFSWLERACDERLFLLRVITVQPGYAPLRPDPRYADLVRRMGLSV